MTTNIPEQMDDFTNISLKEQDQLYILPCIQEKLAPGSLDNENKSGRPYACPQGVYLKKKMDRKKKNICVGNNETSLCTWGNVLKFEGPKMLNCKPEVVWDKITTFINKKNSEMDSINPTQTNLPKKNYYIVSHHNTLKKSILQTILKTDKKLSKKDKRNIANCSCFILEYDAKYGSGWSLTLEFEGFPDKDNYTYFTTQQNQPKKIFPLTIPPSNKGWNELTRFLNNIGGESNKIKASTRIFIIRHGNAFHNKPLRLTGLGINRTIDTNLTPLGIFQARLLGKYLINNNLLKLENTENYNFFCSSYMNRAQHTALELVYALNDNYPTAQPYPKLLELEKFFTKMAILRLERKVKNIDNVINKLGEWKKNTSITDKWWPKENDETKKEYMTNELFNIYYLSKDYDEGKKCYSFTPQTGGKRKTHRKKRKTRRKKHKRKKRTRRRR